jgi:hypothetical protein
MVESYSKSETDLRLEAAEQRGQIRFEQLINLLSTNEQTHNAKFEQLVSLIKLNAQTTADGFKLIDKDITWLKWMLATVILPLIGAIVAFLFSK